MRYKLSEIIEIIGGGTPKTKITEYWGGDIPWLSVKDFKNANKYVYSSEKTITEKGLANSSTKLLEAEDIVISARGTVGELAMIPFPMAFNQSCYGIRGKKDKVNQTYLYYLLKDTVYKLKSHVHGSVFDTITRDTFTGIEVALPAMHEQKRIADLLSSLDDRIENNSQINHHLEQMAQAIFSDKIGSVLYPTTSHTTEAMEQRLGFVNGFAFKSSTYTNLGKYKVITIKNVQDGIVDSSGATCVDELPAGLNPACILQFGDVLLSLTGNVGRVGIVTEESLLLNQRVAKFDPLEKNLLPFWYFLFRRNEMKEHLINIAKGTAQQNLSPIETLKTEISIDESAITKYVESVSPMFWKIAENRKGSAHLAEIRDLLLPRLMTGELTVADLDDAK